MEERSPSPALSPQKGEEDGETNSLQSLDELRLELEGKDPKVENNRSEQSSKNKTNTDLSIDSIEFDDKPFVVTLDGEKPFEKLTLCRYRTREKKPKAGQPEGTKCYSVHKQFWQFPVKPGEDHIEARDEADKLTSIGLPLAFKPESIQGLPECRAYIVDFFNHFNLKSTEFINCMRIEPNQQALISEYNPHGWRHLYFLRFPDFEVVSRSLVEKTTCMIMVESRYPFRRFFKSLLEGIFQEIRIKRLEAFANHFTLQDTPEAAMAKGKEFDSNSVRNVR